MGDKEQGKSARERGRRKGCGCTQEKKAVVVEWVGQEKSACASLQLKFSRIFFWCVRVGKNLLLLAPP